jgi:hypothetical protein
MVNAMGSEFISPAQLAYVLLRNKFSWVPVADRFPSPGERVLVFIPLAEPEILAAYLRHEGMWKTDDGEVFGESEPTHWMRLPERPESNT